MAEPQEQQNSEAKTLAQTASTSATAIKAAGKAAAGDYVSAAVDLLKDERIRNTVLAIILIFAFLITSCSLMIGSAITGVVTTIAEGWEENWNANWEEQSIASNGSALYLYTIGAWNTLDDTLTETLVGLFVTTDDVDQNTTNLSIDGSTTISQSDYETTIQSIYNGEALVGQNGALMKRIELIQSRVKQRGDQIKTLAVGQYAVEAIGYALAEILYESFHNPILFRGVASTTVLIDTTAFAMSDLQALKILAAYSIQHDCLLDEIDMYDLMDYCGWYDVRLTSLDSVSDSGALDSQSIYYHSGGGPSVVFEQDIGGVTYVGQYLNQSVYGLSNPQVPYWDGTFAPQWYYEQIAQIKDHNDRYFASSEKTQSQDIPWGVTSETDDLDISAFKNLGEYDTYGLVDKLFTSSDAYLTVTRTEYESADGFLDWAREALAGTSLAQAWESAYGNETQTDSYGNQISRDDTGNHSFSFIGSANGTTRVGSTTEDTSVHYSYYLTNNATGVGTSSISPGSAGSAVTFSGLSPNTEYTVWERTTTTTQAKAPENPDSSDMSQWDGPTTVTVTSTSYTSLLTFCTLPAATGHQAYQLNLHLKVSFGTRSIDQLCDEILGLWPGSLSETETGADGIVYAKGKAGKENLKYAWTDIYTDPNGNQHQLTFTRQQPYQYETYKSIVEGLATLLGFDTTGLNEPDASYGNDIVAMANAEYEYYNANGLHGGARYWGMVKDALGWTFPNDAHWCVAFVWCVAYLCGYVGEGEVFGPDWIFWVGGAWSKLISAGQCEAYMIGSEGDDYKPVAGDIIFFGYGTNLLEWTHIGIVEDVDPDGTLHIIHGNASNSVKKGTFASYEIGTSRYGDAERIVGYIHPHYPVTMSSDPQYISISGMTQPTTTSRYVTADDQDLMLTGLSRLRTSQLQSFVDELNQQHKALYREELQTALDEDDMDAFMAAWNQICSSGQSATFRRAQLNIARQLYITPMATQLQQETGFDWDSTTARNEILWCLVTSTDQQDAVREVLRILSAGLDSDISDAEFLTAMKTDNFLTRTLTDHADALWPQDNERLRLSWISAASQLLSSLGTQKPTTGTLSDEFYITIDNPDPSYRGHSVPNLTAEQIANIKNTIYGEYGSNLTACIVIAQSIRDNVDRSWPDCNYDNFVEVCKYYGGYPERSPEEYETENVNLAFDYVFNQGGSAVQANVFAFYTPLPSAGLNNDSDYQALFAKPLNFVVQVGTARFFNWDLD